GGFPDGRTTLCGDCHARFADRKRPVFWPAHGRLDRRARRLAGDLAYRRAAGRDARSYPRPRSLRIRAADLAQPELGAGPMRLGVLTGGGEAAVVTGFAIDHRKVAP